ncbi:HNH endonuclease [Clostridium sp.]
MIPICFKEKDSKDKLFHQLIDTTANQRNKIHYLQNIKEIDNWCINHIFANGKFYSFFDIIKADYNEIFSIANAYYLLEDKISTEHENFIINTLYKRRFPRKQFVEDLQVTVCPYCNRNFINSTYQRTMCELDHFYNKDDYPILAVSFHNLIPVCHACNHAKAKDKISYSPHNTAFNTDDLLSFDFSFKGIDYLSDNKQIEIELDSSPDFKSNVEILKLREVYQIHSDIVQECIKKATIFNPKYLKDLFNTYYGLFESEEELYRIVFGNYIEKSSYGKRPLSKFTKDILSKLLKEKYGFDI